MLVAGLVSQQFASQLGAPAADGRLAQLVKPMVTGFVAFVAT